MNRLYVAIMNGLANKTNPALKPSFEITDNMSVKIHIIPPNRIRYLSEIADENRNYHKKAKEQKEVAQKLFSIRKTIETIQSTNGKEKESLIAQLEEAYKKIELDLAPHNKNIIEKWPEKVKRYQEDFNIYQVRGKEIKVKTYEESLSHTKIPKISLPRYEAWGDVLYWSLKENVPGEFPFTAGVYPYKREGEDPTRMFAGEGGPERTNRRFHYVSFEQPAKRLSTAFDSVTLYGEDPGYRPDIYGKIGNSGVSICCLDDAKKLYSGFNLVDPKTSVSMTINGPAATITAFFMNAAIDQQCEVYIKENNQEKEVEKKINDTYKGTKNKQPAYQGDLPPGND